MLVVLWSLSGGVWCFLVMMALKVVLVGHQGEIAATPTPADKFVFKSLPPVFVVG